MNIVLAANLTAGNAIKVDGHVAVIKTTPTAGKYGMVKIRLTSGRKLLARQDEGFHTL